MANTNVKDHKCYEPHKVGEDRMRNDIGEDIHRNGYAVDYEQENDENSNATTTQSSKDSYSPTEDIHSVVGDDDFSNSYKKDEYGTI